MHTCPRLPLLLALFAALSGCGNKGDLYRSHDPAAAQSAPAGSALGAPAQAGARFGNFPAAMMASVAGAAA